MPIKVECPQCDRLYRLPDESAGRRFRCKDCNTMLSVPRDEDDDDFVNADDDDDFDNNVPRRVHKNKPDKPKKRKVQAPDQSVLASPALWIVLIAGLMFFGMCAAIFVGVMMQVRAPAGPAGSPVDLLPMAEVPVPTTFPELGMPQVLQPSGVRMYFVQMPPSATPGHSMAMRIYLPPTDGPPKSIPCVLVAPAGTNLLTGNDMDASDYHAETLPYAEAGMAVVFYSLDGGIADSDNATDAQYTAAYQKFKAAGAGVVNGRNALEFVLAKIPQVDPQLIFTAGHSSAGTVSLLMAAHEERVAGSIAYAPCTDVEARIGSGLAGMALSQVFPGLKEFTRQSSPKNHVDEILCPVFLFHANDDSNVKVSESRAFAKQLEESGCEVEFKTVPTGEHYQSMVDQGVPLGIQWIQKQVAQIRKMVAE